MSGTLNSIDATYNWWGTTDAQAINQTIYDNKNNSTLGKVTFIPFLTDQNQQEVPASGTDFSKWVIALLVLVVLSLFAIVVFLKRKNRKDKNLVEVNATQLLADGNITFGLDWT